MMHEKKSSLSLPVLDPASCGASSPDYAGCDLPADPELIRAGWQKRFIADATRVQEMVEMYKELSFDIKLVDVDVDNLSESCGGCKQLFANFKVVYTRKK